MLEALNKLFSLNSHKKPIKNIFLSPVYKQEKVMVNRVKKLALSGSLAIQKSKSNFQIRCFILLNVFKIKKL